MTDFSNARVGDKVFVCTSGWRRYMKLGEITKVGKLHVTVGSDKFNFKGRKAGGSYGTYIQPFDEKEWGDYLQEKKINYMRNYLNNVRWEQISGDKVTRVYELLLSRV